MKKIPTIFDRNWETDRLVRDIVNPDAQWVFDGEGIATEKIDGTSCMVRDDVLYKRYDLKPGKTPPAGFEQSGEADAVTGRIQGWVPVGDGPEDKYHREAFGRLSEMVSMIIDGTYELIGPKIQGNPYDLEYHVLEPHGFVRLHNVPLDFTGLQAYLGQENIEGIVWHHPDGRMAKIKARDFGIKWPR